jgi:hypothetical protein
MTIYLRREKLSGFDSKTLKKDSSWKVYTKKGENNNTHLR